MNSWDNLKGQPYDEFAWKNARPDQGDYSDVSSYQNDLRRWEQDRDQAKSAQSFDDRVDEIQRNIRKQRATPINKPDPIPTQEEMVVPQKPVKSPKAPRAPKAERKARVESSKPANQSSPKAPRATKPPEDTNSSQAAPKEKIEDIEPKSEIDKAVVRNALKPIRKQLSAVASNSTKSARNSSVVRTYVTGQMHERLVSLSSIARHIGTRIDQTERNLGDRLTKIGRLIRSSQTENGKIYERLKSLRNIGYISKGLIKLRRRVDAVNERTKTIGKQTKNTNQTITKMAEPQDIEPQPEPGLLEILWQGIGTKLGIVKTKSAALNYPRAGGGNRVKNPRSPREPRERRPGKDRPSQISIEAKRIMDRYTGTWTSDTQARILANLIIPGITTLPGIARVLTGTRRGRSIFRKRSRAEGIESKQDREDVMNDTLRALAGAQGTNVQGPPVPSHIPPTGTGQDEKGFLDKAMGYLFGPAIGAFSAGIISLLGTTALVAAVGALAWKIGDMIGNSKKAQDFASDIGNGTVIVENEKQELKEARLAYIQGLNGEPNTQPKINPLASLAYDQAKKDLSLGKTTKDILRMGALSTVKQLRDKNPLARTGNPWYKALKPVEFDLTPKKEKNIIDSPFHYSPTGREILQDNLRSFSPTFDLSIQKPKIDSISEMIENLMKNLEYGNQAPITVNSVNSSVNTNNSSPIMIAPSSMFNYFETDGRPRTYGDR